MKLRTRRLLREAEETEVLAERRRERAGHVAPAGSPLRALPEASRYSTQAAPVVSRYLLGLQNQAGNAAVGTLVARAPIQRDKTDSDREAAATAMATMTIPDFGTFGLLSVSHGSVESDYSVTKAFDEFSPKLAEYATDAKHFESLTIVYRGAPLTITLKNVVISAYHVVGSTDPSTESFTLNAESAKVSYQDAQQGSD